MSMASGETDDRILFVYWGRRGALASFTLELCDALARRPDIPARVSISSANELGADFARFGELVLPFDTFRSGLGAVLNAPAGWRRIGRLVERLEAERYRAVVVLMPHLWTPLLGARLRRTAIRYVVVVHDAEPHPGDRTAVVTPWLLRDVRYADAVVTLTETVRGKLIAEGRVRPADVTALFHPAYGQTSVGREARPRRPFRFLFFGRMARYKGLDLLVDAAEQLRREGVAFDLTVVGEGPLGAAAERLRALPARVVNRWVDEGEITRILAETDTVVLPYREASQSGVAAVAIGNGVPVIATAVGGLAEQVEHGKTGLIVAPVTPEAVAAAMRRLAGDDDLYAALARNVRESRRARSMERFLDELVRIARSSTDQPGESAGATPPARLSAP